MSALLHRANVLTAVVDDSMFAFQQLASTTRICSGLTQTIEII